MQRFEALRELLKDTPADHDFRGFFVGGPTMCTNWDLIAQYMAISLIVAWGDYMAAIEAMERREEAARLAAGSQRLVRAVLHGERTRNRRRVSA
jgi:hypothetical protein